MWYAMTSPRRSAADAGAPENHPGIEPNLGRYPVSITIPVAWGDMDAFKHVNNVVYARWIESARVLYFTRIGLMQPAREDGVGPIVARIAVEYRRPLTYPDTVRVHATTTSIGRSSFSMAYRVWSDAQAALVAVGEDVIVVIDYRGGGRATPVDDALGAAILALEASADPMPVSDARR